jgi:ADP-ribose pyrophosphatase
MKKTVLTRNDVTINNDETVWQGFFRIRKFSLTHKLFRGGYSREISRELFCRGSSVAILLYDPDTDRVGLTRQFRIGCLENEHGPWVWEVVAGVNDKSESPEEVACREVAEETGLDITNAPLKTVCTYYSSPGGSDEKMSVFCALVPLTETEEIHGLEEENEDILFQTFPYEVVINAMLDGFINNAATIIALQWLQLHRQDPEITQAK